MAAKKEKLLMYKGKPLVRKGNHIFYGNPGDKYIVAFVLDNVMKIGELEVASKIDILLQQNDTYMNIKNKMIKKAERTDLWSAIDIGAFWLEDALKHA